jgi:hypothetical protein
MLVDLTLHQHPRLDHDLFQMTHKGWRSRGTSRLRFPCCQPSWTTAGRQGSVMTKSRWVCFSPVRPGERCHSALRQGLWADLELRQEHPRQGLRHPHSLRLGNCGKLCCPRHLSHAVVSTTVERLALRATGPATHFNTFAVHSGMGFEADKSLPVSTIPYATERTSCRDPAVGSERGDRDRAAQHRHRCLARRLVVSLATRLGGSTDSILVAKQRR